MEPTEDEIAESILTRIKPGNGINVTVRLNQIYGVQRRLLDKLSTRGEDWFNAHASTFNHKNMDRQVRADIIRRIYENDQVVVIISPSHPNLGVLHAFMDGAIEMQAKMIFLHTKLP